MNIEDLVGDVRRVTRSARKQLEQVGFESLSSEVGDLNIAFAELAARLIRTEEAYLVEIVRSAGWLSAGAVHALGDLGPAGPSVDLFTSRRLDPSDRWLVLAEALVAKGGLRRTLRVSDGSINSEPGQLSSLLRKLMEGEPPSADDPADLARELHMCSILHPRYTFVVYDRKDKRRVDVPPLHTT